MYMSLSERMPGYRKRSQVPPDRAPGLQDRERLPWYFAFQPAGETYAAQPGSDNQHIHVRAHHAKLST